MKFTIGAYDGFTNCESCSFMFTLLLTTDSIFFKEEHYQWALYESLRHQMRWLTKKIDSITNVQRGN